MTIRVGIGGWTYEPWRGVFYPEGLPQKHELEFAAQHLTTIEINSTFYGRQTRESFAAWAKAAPDGFKFSVKASQYATARKVLVDGGDSITKFLEQGFTELGDKLGPINWQFRATKQFDHDDFARFLDLIPDAQDGMPLRHVLEPATRLFAIRRSMRWPARATWRSFSPMAVPIPASTRRPPTSRMPACKGRSSG